MSDAEGSSGFGGDLRKVVQINEGQLKAGLSEMVRGTVERAWVKKHHPGWYKRLEQGRDH